MAPFPIKKRPLLSAVQKQCLLVILVRSRNIAGCPAGLCPGEIRLRTIRPESDHLIQIHQGPLMLPQRLIDGRPLEVIGLLRRQFHGPVQILQSSVKASGMRQGSASQAVCQSHPGIALQRFAAVCRHPRVVFPFQASRSPFDVGLRPFRPELDYLGEILRRQIHTTQTRVRTPSKQIRVGQIPTECQSMAKGKNRFGITVGL